MFKLSNFFCTLMVEFLLEKEKKNSFFAFTGSIPSLPNMKPREINKINLTMTHLLNEEQAFYAILVISSDTTGG